MSRILAIVMVSLTGAAAAQAAGWTASAHFGWEDTRFAQYSPVTSLNEGCEAGCTNTNSNTNTDSLDTPTDDPPGSPTAVPEPGAIALFGAGLLLAGSVVARRRAKLRN